MDRRTSRPRGLTARSAVAVGVFAATVVPGWTLGDAVERWTGLGVLDWFVTCAWTALAVSVLGPYASYRHRDAWLGLVPLFGWYLACVISWRVALLPYRDWEPRPDELWRARWLTGNLIGYWRADPAPPPATDATARPVSRLTN
jgi:hypothetical protein